MQTDATRIATLNARLRLIAPNRFRRRTPLPPFDYRPLPDANPATYAAARHEAEGWQTIPYNTHWGAWQTNFAMRGRYHIPADWPLDAPLALYLPMGESNDWFNAHPEALITVDGAPFTAMDTRHNLLLLPDALKDHQPHTLHLHGWTGLGDSLWGEGLPGLLMRPCALVQIDTAADDFITLARFTLDAVQQMHADDPVRVALLNALDAAFALLDTRHPANGPHFYNSIPNAHAALQTGIGAAGEPLPLTVHAVGHAHIDTAWLWTLAQTRRKAERTFSSVFHLLEQFPEYRFLQSQPQLYEYVRQDNPALFAQIQDAVRDGSWEPIGGMWIEADTNISGGESLIRQFVLGRDFYREHFGPDADSRVLWLPDTFGFPASLPQIAKLAGFDYFFTIKLRWNEVNAFPFDAFWWQGIDGSRLLAHFSTTPTTGDLNLPPTYNAEVTPETAWGSWQKMQQKPLMHPVLMSYGHGDGGGGPTREMLANLRILSDGFPGLPRVKPSRAIDFYRELETEYGDKLPAWHGELYLETHQGVYTSQAAIKRAVRDTETRLHAVELLAAYVIANRIDADYDAQTVREAWQTLCLNQFHDILPGSSIAPVYADAAAQFTDVTAALNAEQARLLAAVAAYMGGNLLLFNPTDDMLGGVVLWPGAPEGAFKVLTLDGEALPQQRVEDGLLLRLEGYTAIAPHSATTFAVVPDDTSPGPQAASALSASESHLENDWLRVEFAPDGTLTRIYDKIEAREVLTGPANVLQIFEDRPVNYDAWNIDRSTLDHHWTSDPAAQITVIEAGPLRATLEITRTLMNSTVRQHVSLTSGGALLTFDTDIDWQERNMLLKVAFPVNILTDDATHEIQFGHVARPTHRSTSWDAARYEVAHHRRVELRESGYAVALLDDGKYGGDVHENVLRLTLLKAPTYPDKGADLGRHRFRYGLLPHVPMPGGQQIGRAAGYQFNHAPLWHHTPDAPPAATFGAELVASVHNHLRIETVKPAEDGRGVIVRLYETEGGRGTFPALQFGFDVAEVRQTSIYEQDGDALAIADDTLMLAVRPFEIITLRVIPAGG